MRHQERLVVGICVAALVATGLLYGYFLNQTVRNVVARKAVENEINVLSTKIGELEAQYIALKENVTIEEAGANGLVAVEKPQYISRANSDTRFTLRNNQ